MYTAYFKLKENPFSDTTETKFFYLSPGHKASISKCEYALHNGNLLSAIYGDVGTGKTTILLDLKEKFEKDTRYTVAVVSDVKQNSDTALFKAVAEEFGIEKPRRSKKLHFRH